MPAAPAIVLSYGCTGSSITYLRQRRELVSFVLVPLLLYKVRFFYRGQVSVLLVDVQCPIS